MKTEWTVDTLKEYFDKLFETSEKNVDKALASQKELSQIVQAASDKAITKAEEAQKTYNVGHNDLARKMEDQYKQMLPRTEADSREKNTEEKLEAHRKEFVNINQRLDLIAGKGAGVKDFRDWIPWIITVAMFLYLIYSKGKQ